MCINECLALYWFLQSIPKLKKIIKHVDTCLYMVLLLRALILYYLHTYNVTSKQQNNLVIFFIYYSLFVLEKTAVIIRQLSVLRPMRWLGSVTNSFLCAKHSLIYKLFMFSNIFFFFKHDIFTMSKSS